MKKFGKTILICLCLIAVLAVSLTGCSHSIGKELLKNGNFETLDSETSRLTDWEFVYVKKGGEVDTSKKFEHGTPGEGSTEQALYGKRYIKIKTDGYDTAYMKTSVKLYAGQTYIMSVQFNIESSISTESGDNDAVRGYFGFLEDSNFTEINDNKTNGWITKEIYFKPTSTAKYTFVAGIGREDLGGGKGTILFDNLSIKAVKETPVGRNTATLSPIGSVSDKEAGGIAYTVILTLLGAAVICAAYYMIRGLQKRVTTLDNAPLFETDEDKPQEVEAEIVKPSLKERFDRQNLRKTFTSPLAVFIYVLLAAFAVRFILILTVFGMQSTITNYAGVALDLANEGPMKLYAVNSTSLPTGYLYLLYLLGVIGNALQFTERSIGMSMLIRVPNIVADLAVCYFIFKIVGSNYNYKYSAVISGVYAILPATFTLSAGWGMNYSIAMLFLAAMLSFMLEKKHVYVPIMYMFGLLFSNAMLLALPVFIGYSVFFCVKDKKAILPIVAGTVSCFVAFYLLAIPFALNYFGGENNSTNGGLLVFAKMLENIKGNGFISNSSFDFYAIFGLGNNTTNVGMTIVVVLIAILFVVLGIYLFTKTRNRLDYILLAAMSFILWAVFGFGSSVEYIAIGCVLLLIYAGLKAEKRLFKVFGVLSVTNFVNSAVVLTKSGAINPVLLDSNSLYTMYKLDPLYIIGSIITVLTVVYLIWVMCDIMANGREKEIQPLPDSLSQEFKENFTNKTKQLKNIFKGNNNASKN